MASIRWSAAAANDGSGTPTVTKGAGTANGDRLVAIVLNDETPGVFSAVAAAWGSPLSTSTEIADTPKGRVYEQKVTNAGSLPASWTFTPAGFVATNAWVFCIQDLDDDAVIVVNWAAGTLPTSPAGSRLVTAPTITTYTGANPILLTAHEIIVSSANPTMTTPAGMDPRGGVQDADWMLGYAFSDELTGTGATGAKSAQVSLTTAYKWRAVAVAIPTLISASISGAASAPLGGMTAAAAGTITPGAAAAAPLGGLVTAASGTRATTATGAAAPLGGLVTSAAATVTVHGAAAAPLGGMAVAAIAAPITSALGATGGVLNPSIWLVDEADDSLSPLPVWRNLVVAPVDGDPGELSVVIPAGAPGFDALYDRVRSSPQRDALVEVWLDGKGGGPARLRGRLTQKAGDDLRLGADWTFGGAFREQEMGEVVVGPQDTETLELIFTATTNAGTILATAFDLVQDRSAAILPGWTRDFTTSVDSAGEAWNTALSAVAYSPDTTILDIAQDLRSLGCLEFAVTPDGVLQAWNYGTRGVDRSAGGAPVRLQHGANLAQADRRESSRVGEAATAVLGKGAEGQYQWATDPTAEAERGRRVEVVADVGNFTSAGQVLAGAEGQLALLKTGANERNHGLMFGDGHPVPLIDFGIGDYIRSVTVAEPWARLRVRQWRLQFSGPGAARTGDVVVGDMIADWEDRIAARLSAIRRGGAKVGTSTPSPEVDDGIPPDQVEGLTASSASYTDKDGATWAAVAATWSPVTTNADGTATDDIVGYIVQMRFTAGTDLPSGWQTIGQVSDTAADWDGVVADQPIAVRVAAVDRYDHIGATSAEFALVSGSDETPPPVPSITAGTWVGILTGTWDGLGAVGEPMPPDFLHLELLASTSSGFDLDDEYVVVGYLRGAGTYPWSPPIPDPDELYATEWFFKARTWDRNGNASALSAQVSATPVPAGDGDIAAVSIGKLSAGILTAIMTIAGIIQTSEDGSRVHLDDTGIYCFDADDNTILEFSTTTGKLTLVGSLSTGIAGRRVTLDGVSNELRFYPQVGETRFGKMRSFIPGNYPNDIAIEIAAIDSDTSDQIAIIHMLPDQMFHTVAPPANTNAWLTQIFQSEDIIRLQVREPGGSADMQGGSLILAREDEDDDTSWFQHSVDGVGSRVSLQLRSAQMRTRSGLAAGHQGVAFLDDDQNFVLIGIEDIASGDSWGFQYYGPSAVGSVMVGGSFQVVSQDFATYKPIAASAFNVNSGAEFKTQFEALPEAALDVLRGMPVSRWRRRGEDESTPKQVGPVVEDLPEWLRTPGRSTDRVRMRPQPTVRIEHDSDGGTREVDDVKYVAEEEQSTLPDSDSVDLYSLLSVAIEAIRELDAELDELRAERGRTVPPRRSVADLLADVRSGRFKR